MKIAEAPDETVINLKKTEFKNRTRAKYKEAEAAADSFPGFDVIIGHASVHSQKFYGSGRITYHDWAKLCFEMNGGLAGILK